MKKLFLLFFLVPMLACAFYKVPTVGQQTDRLNKVLRVVQNEYGFHDLYIDLKVSNEAHTEVPGVWGDVHCDEKGCHIEVLSAQGFPENFPKEEIENFQDEVVMHEVLHLFLMRAGVPDDFQDKLIHEIMPHLKKIH